MFSIRQRIPENEFSDPTEWGWLNPSGGGFSTVEDFAKVFKNVKLNLGLSRKCLRRLLMVKHCVTTSVSSLLFYSWLARDVIIF